jgi:hypothetical protein
VSAKPSLFTATGTFGQRVRARRHKLRLFVEALVERAGLH